MFNFVFLCPKRLFQFNSRIVRTHFSNTMTLNNWKMIAETRSYIFRWRSRFRRRRGCLSSLMSHGTLLVLEPPKQTNADLKSANEVLVLIHEMVLAYCSPFLMAISRAKRLWYFKHSFPIPPVVVKTKGVNVPCSMSTEDSLWVETLFLVLMDTIMNNNE